MRRWTIVHASRFWYKCCTVQFWTLNESIKWSMTVQLWLPASDDNFFRSRPQVKNEVFIGGWQLRGETKDNIRSIALITVGEDGFESAYKVEPTQVERDAWFAQKFTSYNSNIWNLNNKIVLIDCNLDISGNYSKR